MLREIHNKVIIIYMYSYIRISVHARARQLKPIIFVVVED